jgi:hypothetical protein
MPTLDSQVHAYEGNHPGRLWAGLLQGPAEVTGRQMVAAMDAVGVDGAVLDHAARRGFDRPRRCRPQPRSGRGGATFPAGQPVVLGTAGAGRRWRRETPTRGW